MRCSVQSVNCHVLHTMKHDPKTITEQQTVIVNRAIELSNPDLYLSSLGVTCLCSKHKYLLTQRFCLIPDCKPLFKTKKQLRPISFCPQLLILLKDCHVNVDIDYICDSCRQRLIDRLPSNRPSGSKSPPKRRNHGFIKKLDELLQTQFMKRRMMSKQWSQRIVRRIKYTITRIETSRMSRRNDFVSAC